MIGLVIAATGLLVWSVFGFLSTTPVKSLRNTDANYAKYKAAELPDKCQTPPGYTDEKWTEHMSHHPDQYQECFTL